MLALNDLMVRWFGAITTDSNGNDAGRVVVDGLAPTQRRVIATQSYGATTIHAVVILTPGSGSLILSPLSGDTDITVTTTEVNALGVGFTFYGAYDSVTAGAGTELLVYTS